MKNSTLVKIAAIALCSLSLFASCKKNDKVAVPAAETLNTEKFKQNLITSLSAARGYGIIITQNGQIVKTADTGIGTQSSAGASLAYSIDNYINIASVTKTLTATTFLMFMRYRDITLDSTIGRWLPDTWSKNAQFSKITFRQLMSHTSGIRGSSTSWASLKDAAGKAPDADKSRTYSNINLALFRAILPKMNNLSLYNTYQEGNATDFERWMSERYIMIVQDNIFKKIGLDNRACVSIPGKTMDMFNEAPSALKFATTGDWTNSCGGGGFYLTTRDLSKFIVYLVNTEDFLKANEKTMMETEMIGWWSNFSVKNGTAYGHDGALYSDADGSGDRSAGDPGLQTIILKFPNKVELVMTVNSLGSDWRNLYSIAKEAYNNAWDK